MKGGLLSFSVSLMAHVAAICVEEESANAEARRFVARAEAVGLLRDDGMEATLAHWEDASINLPRSQRAPTSALQDIIWKGLSGLQLSAAVGAGILRSALSLSTQCTGAR